MNLKLLCIDILEDYSLIDRDYLKQLGVDISLLYTSKKLGYREDGIVITNFNFKDILAASESIVPDRIVCFSEELFKDVAKVRELLNIKGMGIASARLFSNKYLMYRELAGKVHTPKSLLLNKETLYKEIKERVESERVFIKPVSCSGSFETYSISSEEDYNNFLLNKKLSIDLYIAQEYIDGELYHSELIVENGGLIFKSARKYSAPNYSMLSSDKLLYSTFVDDFEIEKAVLSNSIAVQQGLNVKNAVMHTEFFIEESTSNLIFIETNLRSPGIGLNNMYKKMLGISYETIMCLLACEMPIPNLNKSEKIFACGYYPLKEGRVKKINKLDVGIDSEWTYFTKEGDCNNRLVSMTKAAMVICSDSDKTKVKKAIESLYAYQLIEVD